MAMRGVLLTGLPGVGKSTASMKVAELCRTLGFRVEGFLTEELREGNSRVGFDVVELSGDGETPRRVPLARLGDVEPCVGRYTVSLQDFESLALPILDRIAFLPPGERVVCIIDEIGKMELFSRGFVSRMRTLLAKRSVPLLVTIALHGGGFVAEAKRIPGLELMEISPETRDDAPYLIVNQLVGDAIGPSLFSKITMPSHFPDGDASLDQPNVTSAGEAGSSKPVQKRRWQAKITTQPVSSESSTTAGYVSGGSSTIASHVESNPEASPSPLPRRVVWWMRNDLRLSDNPLLQRALSLCNESGASLLPVFCYDPCTLGEGARSVFGSAKLGVFRRRFIEESLADLQTSFEQCGSKLCVFDGAPEAVLPLLVEPGDVVMAAQESCPEELASELRVKTALQGVGAHLRLVDEGGILQIFGCDDLQAAGLSVGSSFPEDFKLFYDAVQRHVLDVCQRGLHDPPKVLPSTGMPLPCSLESISKCPTTDQLSGVRKEHSAAGLRILGGETEARTRLKTWLREGGLRSYKATFRRLMGDYSSRLSAHLALGCISPRRVCSEAAQVVRQGSHIAHFIYELCWRDYFRHASRRWGSSLFLPGGPLRLNMEWRRCADTESLWRRGMTGVPLVDAAMRELEMTGYMGNLARQFVAAFFVEECGLDWRIGADHFETMLVDHDPHSNWGQWARSAGVAPTNDAKRQRVGGTRYFDLALQLGADEAANYIRGWVPELSHVTGSDVFAPWLIGTSPSIGAYPSSPRCSLALQKYFEKAATGGKGKGKGSKSYGGWWDSL